MFQTSFPYEDAVGAANLLEAKLLATTISFGGTEVNLYERLPRFYDQNVPTVLHTVD
jgi:hypothetical protein